MSKIDIFLLDNLNNTKNEVGMIKPNSYQELLNQLGKKIKNLPKYYEIYIIGKNNEEIKINNEETYKNIEDFLFIREIDKDVLDESLYAMNYKILSESQQDKLDEKFNCILCSMVIKNENPYLCYQCQNIFHIKCLDNWDNKCKQENKKFCCPSCRNELPKENWNKKVDFEGNRKDNAKLINKMNEYKLNNNMKDNINFIKEKKINELKHKEINQSELIKKYEKYITKTIDLFKIILNKIYSIHNLLNSQNNNKLKNLIDVYPLNIENLNINEISNVINEELDMFKNKLKEKSEKIKDEEKISNLIGNNYPQIINNYNKNQIKLLKIAVNFYKENNIVQMDFNNKIQINNLINYLFNPDIEFLNKTDEFKYITHDKRRKRIKFIFNSSLRCLMDIPIFFTNKELYSIADRYKSFYSTNIILIHNNKILKDDESSLDEISNNDIIWIIEDRLYPDNTYYFNLQNKFSGKPKLNIFIEFAEGKENFILSEEVTIHELIRAIVEKKGYAIKDCKFLYNGRAFEQDDKRKIKEVMPSGGRIYCHISGEVRNWLLGKQIKAITQYNTAFGVGTLDPIKNLFYPCGGRGKIIIGKIVLNSESENYLSFYGINEDFNFIWKDE